MKVLHILFAAGISLLTSAQSAPHSAPVPSPEAQCTETLTGINKDLSIDYGKDKNAIYREYYGIQSIIERLKAMPEACKKFYGWHEVTAKAFLLYGLNLCDQQKFLDSNRIFYMVYENCIKFAVQAEKDGFMDIKDTFLYYAIKAKQLHYVCESKAVSLGTASQITDVAGPATSR